MDKDAVWRKTPRGLEAIERRAGGLSPRLRTLLIMVDGRRRAADYVALAAGLGQAEQLLAQLAGGGFIEAVLPAWAGPLPQPPTLSALTRTEPAPAGVPPSLPLADAKRLAVRQLTDMLGPTAELLCLRIEAARSEDDLWDHLRRARSVLRDARGEGAARRFESTLSGQGAPIH